MNLSKLFDRQTGYIAVAIALALATMLPALVSAATVTERSIALSSSSIDATGVTYQVNFKAAGAAGAFVVDFCSNSPLVGQTCTAPAGFDASAAASTSTGFTDVTGSTSQAVVVGTIAANQDVSVELTGITNPSASGPLYARIVTYDTSTNAGLYTSEALGTGSIDNGGVAMSITDTVGVSGTVLESMSFCVASATITEDCGNAAANKPVLKLGETVGSVIALSPTAVSDGSIFTQISTNAASGAVISLKSSAIGCGGLMRSGAPTACDITPALTAGISAGDAMFGVKTATAAGVGASANGTLQAVTGSGYNASTYALNYVDGDATGVTSTYGNPFLNTAGAPVNNMNMELTFGASVSNDTPAGLYSADLSMIATGKF